MNNNKNLIISVVILAVVIAGGFWLFNKNNTGSSCQAPLANTLSGGDAGQIALDYINKNMLQAGAAASLVNTEETSGLYKISFKVSENSYEGYVTKDGKIFFPQSIDLEFESGVTETIGSFSVSAEEVCSDSGKPIVYFFGSNTCPHCQWEHPIMEEVAKKFEGMISFHNNMDSAEDVEVFERFSTGSIPTVVMGCKYFRVGSGEQYGEAQEKDYLTALTCKLTGGNPVNVCNGVKDLIDQI